MIQKTIIMFSALTMLAAFTYGLLTLLTKYLSHHAVETRRRRQGLCIKCCYNLAGNVSGVCPECGEST